MNCFIYKCSAELVGMLIIHYVLFVILNNLNTRHSIDYHNHGHLENIFNKNEKGHSEGRLN